MLHNLEGIAKRNTQRNTAQKYKKINVHNETPLIFKMIKDTG